MLVSPSFLFLVEADPPAGETRRLNDHELAAAEPRRFLVLDATRDPQTLSEEIWHEVRRRFL